MPVCTQPIEYGQQRRFANVVIRLAYFDVLRSIGTWRWLLVLPIYGLIGVFYGGYLSYDFVNQQARSINLWDVPPAIVSNRFFNVWFVTTGFALLVGDGFLRDYHQHTLALLLSRSPSRATWWIAKVSATGVLALCYTSLMFVAILSGSLFSIPFGLVDSPASLIPTSGYDGWYYRLMGVSMPSFVLLCGLYTAFVLWIIGSVVLTTSLVWRHMIAPIAVILIWGIVSENISPSIVSAVPFLKLVNLSYLVAYSKHLSTLPDERIAILPFVMVSVGALLAIVAVGARRLRRLDV